MANGKRFLTVRILLKSEEGILFLEKKTPTGKGYVLAGGKVNGEELAKKALVRELEEELGIKVREKKLKLKHVLQKKVRESNEVEIVLFFQAKKWEGEIQVLEPQKFTGAVWFQQDALPFKGMPGWLTFAFAQINLGQHYSEMVQ